MTMTTENKLGFIGLGVMGEPMCRNLARKSGRQILASDLHPAPLARLQAEGVQSAALEEILRECGTVFLSLPSGEIVERLCRQPQGLLALARSGQTIIDLSTSPVSTTRELARDFAALGVSFMDAPVARTRAAAEAGTLAVMVGGTPEDFARVQPLIATFASDIALCGGVGCGQVVKLVNNALVFEHTLALAEMMVLGERAGVEPATLLEAVSKGSGDSFVLRNHGRKAMLPRLFPDKSFSPEYVLKDIACVLELAEEVGVAARVTELAQRCYAATAQAGFSGRYFPAVIEVIDRNLAVAAKE